MSSRPAKLFAIACACLGLTFGLAACGGDDDGKSASVELTDLPANPETGGDRAKPSNGALAQSDGATAEQDGGEESASGGDAEGRAIFVQGCAGCHTLAAAGASGSVGPNLDETRLDEAAIAEKVRAGGGGMPSFGGQLEPAQIDAVAAYVAASAGS